MFRLLILPKLLKHAKSCAKLKPLQRTISTTSKLNVTRRTLLYVCVDNDFAVQKSVGVSVDCMCIDLWRSISNDEERCRKKIVELLSEQEITKTDPEWCVRINPVQTGSICQSNIDAVLTAQKIPAAIVLPNVDCSDHLQWFAEQVWNRLAARDENDRGPINLLISIGTPKGIVKLEEICQKALDLATMAPIVPEAVIFDSDSFIESMFTTKTEHGLQFLYARQKLVLVAKAFGLQAIDIMNTVQITGRDFNQECIEGVILGFTGKQVCKLDQIPIIQEKFSPSRHKVRLAFNYVKKFRTWEEDQKKNDMSTIPLDRSILKAAEDILNYSQKVTNVV